MSALMRYIRVLLTEAEDHSEATEIRIRMKPERVWHFVRSDSFLYCSQ